MPSVVNGVVKGTHEERHANLASWCTRCTSPPGPLSPRKARGEGEMTLVHHGKLPSPRREASGRGAGGEVRFPGPKRWHKGCFGGPCRSDSGRRVAKHLARCGGTQTMSKAIPKIQKFMTTVPICINRTDTVATAHKTMREHDIRH